MPFKPRSPGYTNLLRANRPLHRVNGDGPIPCKVMLIGEKPGRSEAEEGKPFVGPAGILLNEVFLPSAGLDRSSIFVTNLVKEFTEYGKPTPEEIARDKGDLEMELAIVNPDIVGLMGTFAVENVLGWDKAEMERNHGIPVHMPDLSGRVALPIYHPAAAMYSADTMPLIIQDFWVLAELVDGTYDWDSRVDKFAGIERYEESRTTGRVVSRAAVDTEGSAKRPWCLTWTAQPGQSELIRPGTKPFGFDSDIVWLHNSLHDLPVLKTMGIELGDDQFRDTMVYAYLLCTEPQGLKPLSWRHCGMEMMSYDEVIHDADRDRALEYLIGADAVEWEGTPPYVIVEGGKARVKTPHSINRRIRSILNDYDKRQGTEDEVDPRKRWEGVDDYVKQEVVDTMGPMPEATLDDVDPAVAKVYACRDSDATFRVAPILERKIDQMGLRDVANIDHRIIPMVARMQEVGAPIAGPEYWNQLITKCETIMGQKKLAIYQLTGAQINPDSGDQVAELLYDQLKMVPSKMTEGGKNKLPRGKTDDKSLEKLVSQHPVIDMVLDYREASKVRSSFAITFLRIAARGESRVHCNFRITRVSSGRLAATNPNLLAIPVRSKLGKEVRGGFVAEEGRILGEYDEDQIEMRQLAHESRDEKLLALFIAGDKDIHTETASGVFGVRTQDVLTEQRYAAKRVGFGIITGITEHGLYDQMALARARRPDGKEWTKDDCKLMIKGWFGVYPGALAFLEGCRAEARRTGMARDMWGRIRYLPGVWSPVKWVAEEAERQSHSFIISAGAQGVMKVAMDHIWRNIMKARMFGTDPILQIHDSLLFEMDDDKEQMSIMDTMMVHYLTTTTKLRVPIKAKGGFSKAWSH